MSAAPSLLDAVMNLPDADRFEIAMAILDDGSPSSLSEDEILAEAVRRQDEIESGAVQTLSYEELLQGISYRPRGVGK